jgi:hypothetical protein
VPRLDTATDVVHGVTAERRDDEPVLVTRFLRFLEVPGDSVLRRQDEHYAAVFVQQAANVLAGSRLGLILVAHSREDACTGISA